jgi:hypothetical protein
MDDDPTPGTSSAALESAAAAATGPVTRNGQAAPPRAARVKPAKPDHTILKPPITTSVTGMKQAILALENSTPEVGLHICFADIEHKLLRLQDS